MAHLLASKALKQIVISGMVLGLILFLWRLQSTRLDSFYDTAITSSVPLLKGGMKPYRDFVTPLPSLTYYLLQISEDIFGPRFRSLGYANLILVGVVFTLMFNFARRVFSYEESLLLALAVCCTSTLQHNILWYNDLGMLWVLSISFVCALIVARGSLRSIDAICLGLLLWLCLLTKMNFFLAGTAITCASAGYISFAFPRSRLKTTAFVLAALCFALCIAPLSEVWVNGTDLRTYLHDTIVLPRSRGGVALRALYTKTLWIGSVQPFYFRNPFRGIIGLAVLLFGMASLGCKLEPQKNASGPPAAAFRLAVPVCLWFFLAVTIFLVVSNFDICSVGESLLIGGLLFTMVAFRGSLSRNSARLLRLTTLGLASWLTVCGVIAIAYHSRLIFRPRHKHDFPFKVMDPNSYLSGIWLSERSNAVLRDATQILSQLGIPYGSDQVYWGPSTELLERVFHTAPLRGFPLWYQSGLTVRNDDVGQLVDQLEKTPVRVFIWDAEWSVTLPTALEARLQSAWVRNQLGDLVFYVRQSAGRGPSVGAGTTNQKF